MLIRYMAVWHDGGYLRTNPRHSESRHAVQAGLALAGSAQDQLLVDHDMHDPIRFIVHILA